MELPVVKAAVLFNAPVAMRLGVANVGVLGFSFISKYPFLQAPSNNAEAAIKYISFFFMFLFLEAYCCCKTIDAGRRRLVQVVYTLRISCTYVNFRVRVNVVARSEHEHVPSN
jgi:hypothetical protein